MPTCPFVVRCVPSRSTRAFAIAWALLVPTAVGARALTVDTTVDDGSLTACDDATTNDCSLRGAITAANANPGADTVVLPSGTYTLTIAGTGEDANATGDLDVTDDLALQGADAATTIIQACAVVAPATTCQAVDRVLDVDPGAKGITVTVSGVTLRNGFAPSNNFDDGGGGVRNSGALTITDGIITANAVDPTSSGSGGGICHRAGTLTLVRSHVDGNQSGSIAGGIFVGSGIGHPGSAPATLVVNDSSVSDNQAGDAGGGIYTGASNVAGKPLITVARSTIAGNVAATQDGGGIRMGRGTLTISDSTISGNSAANLGGGVVFFDAGLGHVFANVTISGNQAARGGGLEFFPTVNGTPVPSLDNCTIADNVAHGVVNSTPAFGGGVEANLSIANSIIARNVSDLGQGADCAGTLTSGGYNLIQDTQNCTITGDTTGDITGVDPNIGPLADNGGPTETRPLLTGSPAIDAGSPALAGSGNGACEAADQRGVARPVGPRCDIDAFEGDSTGTTTTTSTTQTATTTSPSSSTTSTSTTAAPSTTTTTLPGACEPAPTFSSLDCRLGALLAQIDGETGLDPIRPKLVQSLSRARSAVEAAQGACASSQLRSARRRLKTAMRDMIQYTHHLSTLVARKRVPAVLRNALLAAGDPIEADLRILKSGLQCPDDAEGEAE
jgi:hypothetical protein